MALSKITYDNKVSLNPQPSIANVNKCTDSDLNEIKSVVNASIDTINGNGIMGNIVVDGIRTKNMFDKNTISGGDVQGLSPTIRLSSRQIIWLEAGTYTFSVYNMTSPFRWGVQVQNIEILPTTNWPTFIYESGWLSYSTTSHTFTITTAGWVNLMLSKENNATLTPTEAKAFNYQLETGSVATTYKPYQNLNNESDLYLNSETQIGIFLGKPLYRKVFSISNPSSSNTDYVSVSNLNISKLVRLYGFYKNSTGTFGIPFYDSDTNYSVLFVSSGNNIRGRFGTPSNITEVKVVLEYTKTTD